MRNNTLNNYIFVGNVGNVIVDNTINTSKEFTIFLNSSAKNTPIANNTLVGGYCIGDLSLAGTITNAELENNQPVASTFVVTDETYATYFDENGVLRNDVIASGSKVILSGDFVNKNFIFDNTIVSVAGDNSKLINTTIITRNNARILLQSLNIENDNCNNVYAILLNSSGNLLRNITMTVVSNNALQAIRIEEDVNTISNSTIFLNAAAADTDWGMDRSIQNIPTVAILIMSSDNTLNVTKVYVNGTHSLLGASNPSVYGVAIITKTVGDYVSGNVIRSSRVNVEGGVCGYGLVLSGAKDTYTTLSWYNVSSTDYAYGIQVGDGINNTLPGYIYAYANVQAIAAYITAMAPNRSINTNFSKLYIQDMYAPDVTGVCVEGASGVELSNTTYTIRGEVIKIVDINKDLADNIPENIFINAITMNLNFTDASTLMLIKNAANVAINAITMKNIIFEDPDTTLMFIDNAENVNITNNFIVTNIVCDGIELNKVTGGFVTGNYINLANVTGGSATLNAVDSTVVVENNSPAVVMLSDETYSNYFDAEGNFIINDAGANIYLVGDLFNKDLIFLKDASINLTNTGNYVIYNGTITLKGESNTSSFNYNIIGINFKNTDKKVIYDLSLGDAKRNVKLEYCNVETDGDVTALKVYNIYSYLSLTIRNSNFTMNGSNVVLLDFAGPTSSQSATISYCNFNLTAENRATALMSNLAKLDVRYNNFTMAGNAVRVLGFIAVDTTPDVVFDNNNADLTGVDTAIVLNATSARLDFCDNVITQKASTSITTILTNCTIPSKWYYNGNNIQSEGDFVAVAIFVSDKGNAYVDGGVYNLTSDNQIVAINATGSRPVQVTGNKIYVNTFNGETPVVYIENSGSTVSGNYILAYDIYGNGAVADTGITISGNTPAPINIDYEYEQGSIFEENTMTFILTNDAGETVTGSLTAFVNGQEVEVIDNTIKFVPTSLEFEVFVVYTDPTHEYGTTEATFKEQAGLFIVNELNETVEEQAKTIEELNETVEEQAKTIEELNATVTQLEQKVNELEERLNNITKPTKITAADVSKVYNVGANYVVYLKDGLGNAIVGATVTVKIDTKTYTNTTDSTGKITIAIDNLKPATYTTTINYAGDSNHNPASLTTSKITVKKATPKMTASNKSFKLSDKTKKYVVTLKTNNNQVMKRATVTLKVNGKTFTAKTNAKGQATFKLTNLKKKASYTAVVTYKATDCYNAVTKKPKIVVK